MNVIPKGLETRPQDYFEFYRFLFVESLTLPILFWAAPFNYLVKEERDMLDTLERDLNKAKQVTEDKPK